MMELATGIEPATYALQVRCSAVEPRQHVPWKPRLPTIRISRFVWRREICTKHFSKGEETGKLYFFAEKILFSWFRALLSIATIALLPLTARSDCRLCITTESRNQFTLWVVFRHGEPVKEPSLLPAAKPRLALSVCQTASGSVRFWIKLRSRKRRHTSCWRC